MTHSTSPEDRTASCATGAMHRAVLPAIAALALLLTAACSSVSLDAAQALAASGTAAATALHDEQKEMQARLEIAKLQVEVRIDLDGRNSIDTEETEDKEPDESESVKSLKEMQEIFEARAKSSAALVSVYRSFSKLALRDHQSNVEQRISTFAKQTNDYITIVNKRAKSNISSISEKTTSRSTIASGMLAVEAHKRAVLAASREIRPGLEALAEALEGERDYMSALQRTLLPGIEAELRDTLRCVKRVNGKCDSAIDETAEKRAAFVELGFTPTKDFDAKLARYDNLNKALAGVIEHRQKTIAAERAQKYIAMVNAIRELESGHQKLEEGVPIDLARLNEIVETLNKLVNQ